MRTRILTVILGETGRAMTCQDANGKYQVESMGNVFCLFENERCKFRDSQRSLTLQYGDINVGYDGCKYQKV